MHGNAEPRSPPARHGQGVEHRRRPARRHRAAAASARCRGTACRRRCRSRRPTCNGRRRSRRIGRSRSARRRSTTCVTSSRRSARPSTTSCSPPAPRRCGTTSSRTTICPTIRLVCQRAGVGARPSPEHDGTNQVSAMFVRAAGAARGPGRAAAHDPRRDARGEGDAERHRRRACCRTSRSSSRPRCSTAPCGCTRTSTSPTVIGRCTT